MLQTSTFSVYINLHQVEITKRLTHVILSEFSFLLDLCNTLPSNSIILGDLDVHIDMRTKSLVLKINRLLNRIK